MIGGIFTSVGGATRNRIARLNTDGSLDNTFDPGAGASDVVDTICLQADGKIVMGGGFTIINGTNRNYLARLNANGTLDNTFTPNIALAFGGVLTARVAVDGKILGGGLFSTVSGTNRNNFARLNADGSLDGSFDPGTGPDGAVKAIAFQADGKVLIGGSFVNVNGTKRTHIARLLGTEGGAIELVATNYTVTEGAGAALLMVRRTGNTSGSVSAGYAATSGTAQAGTDFVATNGAVVFGPGETSKVIQIPVIDDAQAEADEIFTVTLGNPIGGIVLGSNVVAAVTIVDNDSIPNFTAITPLAGGSIRLTLNGQPGKAYSLQASTNLNNWVVIGTTNPLTTPFDFVDDHAVNFGHRFYRALIP